MTTVTDINSTKQKASAVMDATTLRITSMEARLDFLGDKRDVLAAEYTKETKGFMPDHMRYKHLASSIPLQLVAKSLEAVVGYNFADGGGLVNHVAKTVAKPFNTMGMTKQEEEEHRAELRAEKEAKNLAQAEKNALRKQATEEQRVINRFEDDDKHVSEEAEEIVTRREVALEKDMVAKQNLAEELEKKVNRWVDSKHHSGGMDAVSWGTVVDVSEKVAELGRQYQENAEMITTHPKDLQIAAAMTNDPTKPAIPKALKNDFELTPKPSWADPPKKEEDNVWG